MVERNADVSLKQLMMVYFEEPFFEIIHEMLLNINPNPVFATNILGFINDFVVPYFLISL